MPRCPQDAEVTGAMALKGPTEYRMDDIEDVEAADVACERPNRGTLVARIGFNARFRESVVVEETVVLETQALIRRCLGGDRSIANARALAPRRRARLRRRRP